MEEREGGREKNHFELLLFSLSGSSTSEEQRESSILVQFETSRLSSRVVKRKKRNARCSGSFQGEIDSLVVIRTLGWQMTPKRESFRSHSMNGKTPLTGPVGKNEKKCRFSLSVRSNWSANTHLVLSISED